MQYTGRMTSAETAERTDAFLAAIGGEWWRTAVIYQIYPRSFADASGDGIGDLPGITSHLDDLKSLGVDAIWLSPFQRSPQKDAGYDVSDYCDVDPLFGTLADFDAMLAGAHDRGIRVIVDLVPNHSSDQHEWFQQALVAAPGSAERARYMFRDGQGAHGELPPNNWESVFGGPAWTRVVEPDGQLGQWYLHLFDSSQPDFDWSNEEVREEFRRILRFWLDRGVDGFRVDVAHGLIKAEGLPDYIPDPEAGSMGGEEANVPYWGQDAVHEVYRDWRKILEEYEGDRALCRRGVAADRRADGAVGALRRDAPGLQLPLPLDRVECRGPPRGHRRVAAGVPGRRRAEHVGAVEPRRRAPRVAPRADRREPAGSRHRPGLARQADPRGRPRPRPRRDDAHARAARLGVPVPGRGARPARGHRHPRRRASGPDLVPHERRAVRPRRLPRADPVERGCPGLRLQPHRCVVAAPAGRVGDARPRRAVRRRGIDARAVPDAPRRASRARRSAPARSSGSTGYGTDVVAFRNGNVTVVANTGSHADRAAGAVS